MCTTNADTAIRDYDNGTAELFKGRAFNRFSSKLKILLQTLFIGSQQKQAGV